MKLLIVSDYYSTWDIGGASRVVSVQIKSLTKKKEITSLELISGYPNEPEREQCEIPWHREKYKSVGYLPKLFFRMLLVRFNNRPDIVHIHQPLLGLLAKFAFVGIPCVYHFHSYWYDEKVSHSDGSLKNKSVCSFKGWIEKFVLKKMDAFIVLSKFSYSKLNLTIKTCEKINIVPGSLDLEKWQLLPVYQIEKSFSFISVRRLDPRMGLDVLLEAFALLPESNNFTLTIVGTGRFEQELYRLTKELNLENKVTFTGRLSDDDLKIEMSKHDCMVIPTKSIEGFGMTVIEAFALGLPVLATKTGALGEFCCYNDVFYAVDKADPNMLAKGLKWIAENFSNRDIMRKKCRKVSSVFDMHKTGEQYVQIYKDLKC